MPPTATARATHYTLIEGGEWHAWETRGFRPATAIRLEDGWTFDLISNSWRNPKGETLVPPEKKEQLYHFHIAIPIRLIGPMTELLAQDGLLMDMRHESAPPQENGILPVAKRKKKSFAHHYPKLRGGMTGAEVILQSLKAGPRSVPDLALHFESLGRSPISASSACSKLYEQGKIGREIRNDGRTWVYLLEKK